MLLKCAAVLLALVIIVEAMLFSRVCALEDHLKGLRLDSARYFPDIQPIVGVIDEEFDSHYGSLPCRVYVIKPTAIGGYGSAERCYVVDRNGIIIVEFGYETDSGSRLLRSLRSDSQGT